MSQACCGKFKLNLKSEQIPIRTRDGGGRGVGALRVDQPRDDLDVAAARREHERRLVPDVDGVGVSALPVHLGSYSVVS